MLDVDDAAGERLELEVYLDDFDKRFWAVREVGVWKLEREQHFRQPESPSWTAFAEGAWDEALRLLETNRSSLEQEFQKINESGVSVHRVRVVEEPIVAYVQWELHSLHLRAQCGENIRIVGPEQVSSFESATPLPEIVTLGTTALYRLVYTEGLLDGAILFTHPDLVARCQQFVQRLFEVGEELPSFFTRAVANLPPPSGQ